MSTAAVTPEVVAGVLTRRVPYPLQSQGSGDYVDAEPNLAGLGDWRLVADARASVLDVAENRAV